MTSYKIQVDLGRLGDAITETAMASAYPAVHQAVVSTAEGIRADWQAAVNRAMPIRDAWTRQRNDAAVASISVTYSGPFSATVASSNQDVIGVEEGFPARDLKLMLQTSSRTKVSARGKRYLTIPMRHGTPGNDALAPAMPKHIAKMAAKMGQSEVIGQRMRPNALGFLVPQSVYRWDNKPGDQFNAGKKKYLSIGALPAGLAPKLLPSHKTDPYAGMRRMAANSGGAKSSTFLTFRVMSESSPPGSWTIPAKPGQYVLRDIAGRAQGQFADRLSEILGRFGT